jgi:hypothetical protein
VKSQRRDRDRYAEAAKAMRWAMSQFDAMQSEAKWSPAETHLFHIALAVTGSYSRLWQVVTLPMLSKLTGRDRRTCARALQKLDAYGVIEYEPGLGREWSRLSLPRSERRSHVAASRSAEEGGGGVRGNPLAAGDGASATASEAVTYDRFRGGDMWPPHIEKGLSRSELVEKEDRSLPTSGPSVEGEGGETEQSPPRRSGTVYFDLAGNEINPDSNRRSFVDEVLPDFGAGPRSTGDAG